MSEENSVDVLAPWEPLTETERKELDAWIREDGVFVVDRALTFPGRIGLWSMLRGNPESRPLRELLREQLDLRKKTKEGAR